MEIAVCIKTLIIKNKFEVIKGNQYTYRIQEFSCDFDGDTSEAKIYDSMNRHMWFNLDLHVGYMFKNYFITLAEWRERQIDSILED